MSNKSVGKTGETIASIFLKLKGYKIIDKNYNTPYGEIDIICRRRKTISFVEVKTRKSNDFGSPADAVNYYKKLHIINSARHYIRENSVENFYFSFDVVEVYLSKNKILKKVNHIPNAFTVNFNNF